MTQYNEYNMNTIQWNDFFFYHNSTIRLIHLAFEHDLDLCLSVSLSSSVCVRLTLVFGTCSKCLATSHHKWLRLSYNTCLLFETVARGKNIMAVQLPALLPHDLSLLPAHIWFVPPCAHTGSALYSLGRELLACLGPCEPARFVWEGSRWHLFINH